jgi:[protein-PII] uridylyltransferase
MASIDNTLDTDRLKTQLAEQVRTTQQQISDDFFAGKPAEVLVQQRAAAVDQVLQTLWQHLRLDNKNLTLIAVGGYGRGTLHPYSDIDLLLIHESPLTTEDEAQIAQLWSLSWDIGLEVGHSVRTLEQCRQKALDDITIATNYLDARLLCGASENFRRFQDLQRHADFWPGESFFMAKSAEQLQRHQKHHQTEFNLEPNIKAAPGGLRDWQTLLWVSAHYFGTRQLNDLLTQNIITEAEYQHLHQGHLFLTRLRFALHLHSKRDDNRLLFDYQKTIAQLLGYSSSQAEQAVERMMKDYYRTAMHISQLNEMLMQHFKEAILDHQQSHNIQPINADFQSHNDFIEVTAPDVFKRHPSALLEIFVILANTPKLLGIRAATARLLRDHINLIDDAFRENPDNHRLFLSLLRAPHELYTQLTRMNRFGILSRYIPAFAHVTGQMQFDLFHIYTVDAHILQVVRNLRRFRYEASLEQFPIAASLFQQFKRLEILYLAALFHDLTKGRGGDHSELGAIEAKTFCLHHGLSEYDAELVSWLVKYHLLMSHIAQKKDLSDPDVIHAFAQKVGNLNRLNHLYTFTVADICGTNPNLWNTWRAGLLARLYQETRLVLQQNLSKPIDKQEQILATQSKALACLADQQVDDQPARALWKHFGDEYFLREQPDDIAWHTQAILQHHSTEPLVSVKRPDSLHLNAGIRIFIYTEDQLNLFLATVATLDQLQLTVLDAQIMTSTSQISLDTYFVQPAEGSTLAQENNPLPIIQKALLHTLTHMQTFKKPHPKRLPRQLKPFMGVSQIILSHELQTRQVDVEVITLDRPGLLVQIADVFTEFELAVHSAKIVTLGERAEDIFSISTKGSNRLQDPAFCQQLSDALQQRLDTV